MACDRTDTILHAYFDNELDPLGAADFALHLARCPECTEALASLRSLRSSLSYRQLYEKTPSSFRRKVLAAVHAAGTSSIERAVPPAQFAWRELAVAAAFLLLAYIGWHVASVFRSSSQQQVLAAEVVDAHLRSLQPGHLTDVLSTDQHTVKPWFAGKVDFAPPVHDFAEEGFPLEGGRLDVVHGRSTAVLVYGRHKHLVNIFIWPTDQGDAGPQFGSLQGYQWISWRQNGMEFYAVSDVSAADLALVQKLFAR